MNETYRKLAEAIEWGEEDDALEYAQQALDEGHDPADIIKESMSLGVRRAGDRFNEGEFFLPELMLAGEAMKAGLSVVMPVILASMQKMDSKGRIMMDTVEGDVHDIGKNICISITMVHIPPAFERLWQEGLTENMTLLAGGVAVNRR
ncbi:MAG: B12-binding domain-containing protein [Anaerolineae bacterium]